MTFHIITSCMNAKRRLVLTANWDLICKWELNKDWPGLNTLPLLRECNNFQISVILCNMCHIESNAQLLLKSESFIQYIIQVGNICSCIVLLLHFHSWHNVTYQRVEQEDLIRPQFNCWYVQCALTDLIVYLLVRFIN